MAFQDAPKEFYGFSFIPRVGFSFPSAERVGLLAAAARHVDASLADTSSPMSATSLCNRWLLEECRSFGGEEEERKTDVRKIEKWKG